MLKPVNVVSPRNQSRCPSCHCFVRLDAGTCSACGIVFTSLTEEKQPPETFTFHHSDFSNIRPDGKVKRSVQPGQKKDIAQLDLFGGSSVE